MYNYSQLFLEPSSLRSWVTRRSLQHFCLLQKNLLTC